MMPAHDEGGGASLSTDHAAGTSAATDISLREHLEALRQADKRFDAERDRRYTEVAAEREKALKIKETADLAALELAREIQTYKDEAHNGLLGQLRDERAEYPTRGELNGVIAKIEATVTPLQDFVQSQRGARAEATAQIEGYSRRITTLISAAVAIVVAASFVFNTLPL